MGLVYVYDASDGTEIGQLFGWYWSGVEQFGHAVATSGGVLVVGAPKADFEDPTILH